MAEITLQVVDGFEKGRIFSALPTPVTIGREEDNTIQLNDERVSRFHVKIQEDGGRFILTDLDSTNGTRVNGHPIQMRVLQVGDQLVLGRSLLLFGSQEEIALRRQANMSHGDDTPVPSNMTIFTPDEDAQTESGLVDFDDEGIAATIEPPPEELFPNGPPELPSSMRPLQTAQVSDILAYLHEQIARVLAEAHSEPPTEHDEVHVPWGTWQRLLKLEMELAVYMRILGDPQK